MSAWYLKMGETADWS